MIKLNLNKSSLILNVTHVQLLSPLLSCEPFRANAVRLSSRARKHRSAATIRILPQAVCAGVCCTILSES